MVLTLAFACFYLIHHSHFKYPFIFPLLECFVCTGLSFLNSGCSLGWCCSRLLGCEEVCSFFWWPCWCRHCSICTVGHACYCSLFHPPGAQVINLFYLFHVFNKNYLLYIAFKLKLPLPQSMSYCVLLPNLAEIYQWSSCRWIIIKQVKH